MTNSSSPSAGPEQGHSAAPGSGRYAVFRRQNQFFGLGIEFVTEVLPGQALTRVPRAQGIVLGVLSLRGEILPVVTIDDLLELEPRSDDPALPIIVLRWRDMLLGIRVDAIQSVLTLNASEIQPHPAGPDTHFAGIWRSEGENSVSLTLLAGTVLLDALHQQTTSNVPTLQSID